MQDAFFQFFRPTKNKLSALWEKAIITFDASVLLNLYGLSDQAAQSFMHVISDRQSQLWLPHQFGLEFSRNRPKVISRQIKNFQSVERDLEKLESEKIRPRKEHPYLSATASEAFNVIRSELAANRRTMEKRMAQDSFLEFVQRVFVGRVGPSPDRAALDQLHSEAAARFKAGISPGNCDLKAKGVPDAYGDYIAWSQIIEHSKAQKSDFLLVIDDVKEDWWAKEGSRMVGPRPELLREFFDLSNQTIWMYTSDGFLRAAKEFTSASIDEATIDEVKAYLENERQYEAIDKEAMLEKPGEPATEKAASVFSAKKASPTDKQGS